MELHHLRYFEAVARRGHVTWAARELHIAQPSLSKQIQALEAELGVVLFDRVGRRVELTEAGQLLLPYARRVLREVAEARRALQQWGSLELGQVAIGAPPTVGAHVLPRALAAFHQRYPAIELRLLEMGAARLAALLEEGTIDLAVISVPLPGLVSAELFSEELVVAVAHDHPLAQQRAIRSAELAAEQFILFPFATLRVMQWLAMILLSIGQLRQVHQACVAALDLLQQIGGHTALGGYCRFFMAQVLFQWNELDTARTMLRQTIRDALAWQQIELQILGYLGLAEVELNAANLVEAQQALQEAEQLVRYHGFASYLPGWNRSGCSGGWPRETWLLRATGPSRSCSTLMHGSPTASGSSHCWCCCISCSTSTLGRSIRSNASASTLTSLKISIRPSNFWRCTSSHCTTVGSLSKHEKS